MPFGKEVGLDPGHIVLDGDPVRTQRPSLPQQLLPTFRPMFTVIKQLPISATADLFSYNVQELSTS